MKRFIIFMMSLIFVCTIFLCWLLRPKTVSNSPTVTKNPNTDYEYNNVNENDQEDSLLPEDLESIITEQTHAPLNVTPESTSVLVNRDHLLPSTYVPKNLVVPKIKFVYYFYSDKRKMRKDAADAIVKLFNAAKKDGITLVGVSGYRSYKRQQEIYKRNVKSKGKDATDTVSAIPGSSEHQTGLAMDVSAKSANYQLKKSFADTKEGKWLAKHCHEYGYIIRYPEDKPKVTGYTYEPWHIRYVGEDIATHLYKNALTLEEFYGVAKAPK